jgi:hypothetical protein
VAPHPLIAALRVPDSSCRPCAGHPRLQFLTRNKDVDGRDKPGHDGESGSIIPKVGITRVRGTRNSPLSPQGGEREIKPFSRRVVCARGLLTTPPQSESYEALPPAKEGSGAPKDALSDQCPRQARLRAALRRRAAFRRSRLRHSPPASTPMAQLQNRVSRGFG